MKNKTMVQTFDGKLHESYSEAKRHTQKAYDDLLLSLARSLTGLKYTQTAEFIDAELVRFVILSNIKKDLTLENPEDE